MSVSITLVSDIICPWCFVGKRRLEHAITSLNVKEHVNLSIAPHQLYPDTPLEGRPIKSFGKKGHGKLLKEAGEQVGISFRWDLISIVPNTLECHRRLMQITDKEIQWKAKEALLQAYFCEGVDLSKENNLSTILGPFETSEEKNEDDLEIIALLQKIKQRGITAVPTFIIDGEHHVTGAMEQSQWEQFLKRKILLT